MRSIIKILIAVFAVCMIAPAFSAVENVKVGGDIFVTGVLRNDWYNESNHNHGVLTQARVWVSADLTENVSTMIRLINERLWGYVIDDDYYYDILVDLAYLKVKDLLTPGLTLTVGRQEIELGEGLVVGSAYNVNHYIYGDTDPYWYDLGLQKAFDAIRIDYAPSAIPFNMTMFACKIDENTSTDTSTDFNLYGVNFGFKVADVTNIDLYYVRAQATDYVNTGGIRIVSGIPGVQGFSGKLEWAKHFSGSDDWALLAGIKYEIPASMKPYVALNYSRFMPNWASEGIFPSNIGSRIGPILYGNEIMEWDLHAFNLGIGFQPAEKWSIGLNGYYVKGLGGGNLGSDDSYEADLTIDYKYTEDLTFGVTGGSIVSGSLFSPKPWQILGYAKISF